MMAPVYVMQLSDILPISRFTPKMSASAAVSSNSKKTKTTAVAAPPSDPITVDYIRVEDTVEVLNLLKTFFFKDEPLNAYLDLGECKELEEYSTKCIPDACSFKAVNSKGEIIGVLLNGVNKRPPKDYIPKPYADDCQHPKFKKVLGLMDHIDAHFNIFDHFPTHDKLLDGKILSVSDQYRGMGIAGLLTNRTIEFMRENKISLITMMCSSHFSARVVEKLDFKEIFAVPYTDYLDANGEQVLCPVEPHLICRIMYKEI